MESFASNAARPFDPAIGITCTTSTAAVSLTTIQTPATTAIAIAATPAYVTITTDTN